MHHRVADRCRAGRLLLAVDAAHVHSPAGGQGMYIDQGRGRQSREQALLPPASDRGLGPVARSITLRVSRSPRDPWRSSAPSFAAAAVLPAPGPGHVRPDERGPHQRGGDDLRQAGTAP
ncbi:FAD-dependent monooxygenase [Streptomyces neyagawaensis]|uniref:FAD-dependent monooxygenase n=1 Tax=Streptomyces neyagawaensis TaxID=42238 RepID=UPI003F4D28E8